MIPLEKVLNKRKQRGAIMELKNHIEIDEKDNEIILKRGLIMVYIRNLGQDQILIDFEKEGNIIGALTTEMYNICNKCTSFGTFKEFVKSHPEDVWRTLHSVFVSTLTF
jgi:hypothetical protein